LRSWISQNEYCGCIRYRTRDTSAEVRKLLNQGKSKDEVAEILMKKGGYDADDVGATLERELKKRTKKIAVALVVTGQAKEKTVKQLVFASTEEASGQPHVQQGARSYC
jgi:hypothetical protein